MESLEGLSARDMLDKLPYSYESITLGLTSLSDLELCQKELQGLIAEKAFHNMNEFDGNVMIEVWKSSSLLPYHSVKMMILV